MTIMMGVLVVAVVMVVMTMILTNRLKMTHVVTIP